MRPETVLKKIEGLFHKYRDSYSDDLIIRDLKAWLVLQRDGEVCECGHHKRDHDTPIDNECLAMNPLDEDEYCPCTEFMAALKG